MSITGHNCFTIKYPYLAKAITCNVLVAPPFDLSKHPIPKPSDFDAKEYVALWDTGATNSVITSKVASECNLHPLNLIEVHTANGSYPAYTHLISLFLPNNVVFPDITVTEAPFLSGDIDILIGMDVIARGDFTITNGNNNTTMSFRMPSIANIDFKNIEPIINTGRKVGRNDLCPCGSGLKYKRCCGKNT